MTYGYILIIIPIVLLTAFIVMIAKKMTEGSSLVEAFGMKNAVLGVIVLMVGMLVMIPIIDSVDPAYEYDSDSKTFTVYRNITGTEFSWGNATAAESLIIENGVTTISDGAFADFDDLKYISIPESATDIGTNAFGVTLKDYLDQTIADPEAGEYVGTGDGTLYFADASIFTFNPTRISITGLTSDASAAVNIVIPSVNAGQKILTIGSNAFSGNTSIERVLHVPGSELTTVNLKAFYGCSSLASASLPETVEDIASEAFRGCTSLADFEFPGSLRIIGPNSFRQAIFESVILPDEVSELRGLAFQGNTAIKTVFLPSSLTQVSTSAFNGCTGITSVTFAEGFAPSDFSASWADSWTFYDSDGTTVLDKTVASNLAGFTFQGTASALVKVAPGLLSLTPDQIQQVHLHDAELQNLKDHLTIDPLPFQPSVQTEDPVAA